MARPSRVRLIGPAVRRVFADDEPRRRRAYTVSPGSALACPIHVFGGSEDILVSESDLSHWRSRTSAEFSLQMLKGNHFHVSDRKQLFAALRPVLSVVGTDRAKVA